MGEYMTNQETPEKHEIYLNVEALTQTIAEAETRKRKNK